MFQTGKAYLLRSSVLSGDFGNGMNAGLPLKEATRDVLKGFSLSEVLLQIDVAAGAWHFGRAQKTCTLLKENCEGLKHPHAHYAH